jgi:RNA polymerase sigma factor (sigma-70 family)
MSKPIKAGYYASHPEKFYEYTLLQLSKDTDIVKANRAKERLLAENEGFLMHFIGDWVRSERRFLLSELLHEARLAFLDAVNNYDLSRDLSIRTFSRYHLLKVKANFFKKQFFEEIKEEHPNEVCFQSELGDEYIDLRDMFNEAIEHLSLAEQEVIRLHFFSGLKNRDIAARRDCSEARISALMKGALKKLKKFLMARGVKPGFFDIN